MFVNRSKNEDTDNMNDLNEAIDNINISFPKRVKFDKLTFYYISLPIILLGHLTGALLLSAMQIGYIELYNIGIWLLLCIIMFTYQFYQFFLFKQESEESKLNNADIWLDKYYTNVLLSGIIWGSSAILLFPQHNLLHQMIIPLFLFGIGFSFIGVLAAKSDLLLTYVLTSFAPLLVKLIMMDDEIYTNILYVVLLLMLTTIISANYYGRLINNSLNNRQHFMTIKHTHQKLKERFFALFDRAPVGIYYYNEKLELQDVNAEFLRMNKVDYKTKLIDKTLYDISSKEIIESHENVFEKKTGNYRGPYKILLDHKNIYVNLSTVPMLDSQGDVAGGICIINDITKEVNAQEKIIKNAYYDMLTSIPNRTLLMDKLENFITQKELDEFAALLFFDIDHFKNINDTFGHQVGDNLLKQFTDRIEKSINDNVVFARVSGNKFAILITNLGDHRGEAKTLVNEYISQLQDLFNEPLNIVGKEYHLTFSMGVVLFNNTEMASYDILKSSETAMYEAKKNARGTVKFYQSTMSQNKQELLMIESDIHKAIKNDEFTIKYQPQLDLKTNKIIGAEALMRWEHPERGFISPGKFIPIAEESGVIIKLEEYIFDKILCDVKTLVSQYGEFPLDHIAINVSTINFLQPDFTKTLLTLINKYQIDPHWIDLEITETGIMRNIDDAIRKIKELKNLGFSFSIDDFGTGYSSLSYLKKLPLDMIKIDQSFVLNALHNKGDSMIIESVISIGEKFNLKVLAEGVENVETLEYLKKHNCGYFQGYYAYQPLSLEAFKQLI